MNVINQLKEVSFEGWISQNVNQDIQDLNKAFNDESIEDQVKYIKGFTKKITEYFGDELICKVVDIRPTHNKENYKIFAIVMQLHEGSIQPCSHPLYEYTEWKVSTPINSKSMDLKIGDLFKVKYYPERNPMHLSNLIGLKAPTIKLIDLSFEEQFNLNSGTMWIEAAKEVFTEDVEKVVLEKCIQSSDLVFKELETMKKSIENEEQNLERETERLISQKENLQKERSNFSEEKKHWLRMLEKLEHLAKLEQESISENQEKHAIKNPEEVTKLLQALIYHNSDDGLVYEKQIIELFLYSLKSNILTILTGPSGTGKSSIVSAMAKALPNAKAKVIPVQSSWTDTQDLLGYFNPNEKCFVASPFMEALADARNDEDNLHLICLDEMNLAHVEYYFSEFLSAREKKEPSIRLYNKRYYINALNIVNERLDTEPDNIDVIHARDLVHRYPYEFEIPVNVRFIGTLNMDHTVKPLSPKLIDRSMVIELGHLERKEKQKIVEILQGNKVTGCLAITLEEFLKTVQKEDDILDEVIEIINLSQELEIIKNAILNERGYQQVMAYLKRTPEKERTSAVKQKYADQLIHSKLLPRIEVSKRNEESLKTLHDFEKKIASYPRSLEKLNDMLNNEKRIVQYW